MSIKQDGARVRTAEDLERKYKLAEIQKAFEQSETGKGVTRINKIMEDFVNTIVGTLSNFEGLEDGKIIAYFHKGVPSSDTFPENEWTDGRLNHINDIYYDRDSAKAYVYTNTTEDIKWVEETDKNKINVLALANATVDVQDNKRVIFLEQPIPPYDNGDLWLKDGVIYVCQISKPETEEYEEHDFIISSSYNGDTLAIKVGTELEVLKGTVLKVTEDAKQLKVELTDKDKEMTSEIEFINSRLRTIIRNANGESMLTQDGDELYFSMTQILETLNNNSQKVNDLENSTTETSDALGKVETLAKQLEDRTAYMRVSQTEDGKPIIELGAENSDFKVEITNEALRFYEGSNIPAYISNETFHTNKINVITVASIGGLEIVKRGNGHMSIMPKGVL